ncbi:hypothetical protein L6164_010114 [Bauhinia variegata]|uniref:Uncharacterized protein n=1 Tax=Bauhinia variegata TaxID=167791 RepID=A0ACB9PNC6_BAUVA|nr:hypothetical protein L6164_010114 [Bauhinia variegata]
MGERSGSGSGATKQAVVVVGALACVWLAVEFALKPILDRTRAAIDKSDPARDPDDVPPPDDPSPNKEDAAVAGEP